MADKVEKKLQQFLCEANRRLEEQFAAVLAEDERVRLFFICGRGARTDGQNIIVDPAEDNLYRDPKALEQTGKYLHWPRHVLADTWTALQVVTRAQTIHECLHLLYTVFPNPVNGEPRASTLNRAKTLAMIANIIEDAYIEAAGCTVYDNLAPLLRFGRVARLFAVHPSPGTAEQVFEGSSQAETIIEYLGWMGTMLLYPMVKLGDPPEELAACIRDTEPLFWAGSAAASPRERFSYACQIFDRIQDLIPEDEPLPEDPLYRLLGGSRTHSPEAVSLGDKAREGRTQEVSVRLFTQLDGSPREDWGEDIMGEVRLGAGIGLGLELGTWEEDETAAQEAVLLLTAVSQFKAEQQAVLALLQTSAAAIWIPSSQYDCPVLHWDIRIQENHPKVNFQLQRAYQNICSKHQLTIHSYSSRFAQLLKARVSVRDEKYPFGAGITSSRLGDPQRRFWYRNLESTDIPELAILLLIDGSGSMYGARCRSAMESSVILHEVLRRQGIPHAIVEHRGHGGQPEIEVNILKDFKAREEEKINLMQIAAGGDNRDGLALFWAERYLGQHASEDRKLILVLSDGLPAHAYDRYYPPVSTQDTANAVRKITRRGTNIIAVALDDPGSTETYDQLQAIYPDLVSCSDLSRLPGQLLTLIGKVL